MKANARMIPLVIFAAAALLVSGTPKPHPRTGPPSEHPNVVFIVVDDMNRFPVLHNYPGLQTPALDSLAAHSLNFIHASCAVPLCAPSRAAFFSGISPTRTGVYRNYPDIYDSSILSHEELMPECFKRNGYITWGGGKTFHMKVNDDRENKMFDNAPVKHGGYGPYAARPFWYGNSGWASVKPWTGPDTDFPDVRNANGAIAFLKQRHDKPFFLYYGLFRPHTPYTAPKRFYDLYKGVKMTLPAGFKPGDLDDVPGMGRDLVDSMKQYHKQGLSRREVWLKLLRGYCANVSFADWDVGRVLKALDQSAYARNTIVILCSDNGFHCGTKNHWTKKTMWEQADMIPLMIRLPGGRPFTCTRTVSLLDLFPTLVDYCHLDPPPHVLDGKSLTPLFKDPRASWNRPDFTTWGPDYSSVTDGRYRYIRYPDGSEELYDHQSDPYEWKNVVAEPGMQDVIKRLSASIPSHFTPSIPPGHAKKKHPGKKPGAPGVHHQKKGARHPIKQPSL